MPVLGVIFLRHAANRFEAAHRQIAADQASGKMPKRKVAPRGLYSPPLALPARERPVRLDHGPGFRSAVSLPKLVTDAMTAIEAEFEPLAWCSAQGLRHLRAEGP